MPGLSEYPIGWPAFNDMAEIHDEDAVAQKPHDIEVVADKQVREIELPLSNPAAAVGSGPAPTRRAPRLARRGSVAAARPRWPGQSRREPSARRKAGAENG